MSFAIYLLKRERNKNAAGEKNKMSDEHDPVINEIHILFLDNHFNDKKESLTTTRTVEYCKTRGWMSRIYIQPSKSTCQNFPRLECLVVALPVISSQL